MRLWSSLTAQNALMSIRQSHPDTITPMVHILGLDSRICCLWFIQNTAQSALPTSSFQGRIFLHISSIYDRFDLTGCENRVYKIVKVLNFRNCNRYGIIYSHKYFLIFFFQIIWLQDPFLSLSNTASSSGQL